MGLVNANNIVDIREIGYKALSEALGSVGFVRFMQQYDNGTGDYTREKYEPKEDENEPWDELEAEISRYNTPEPHKQVL